MEDDCCLECFSDDDLKSRVMTQGVLGKDPCHYCQSKNTKRIAVRDLEELFLPLVGLHYVTYSSLSQAKHEDPMNGDSLPDLFCGDFDPFSAKVERPDELLYAILNSTSDWKEPTDFTEDEIWFREEDDWGSRSIDDAWSKLKSAIKRFGHSLVVGGGKGIGADPDVKWAFGAVLSDLQHSILCIPQGLNLWRARRGEHLKYEAMSAPPPEKAFAGRGNLQGQPVLYLSNDEKTAVSEVRPSKGEIVSLCKFKLTRKIKVCNLQDKQEATRPFLDFEKYKARVGLNRIRRLLSSELSRPIRRGDETKDYLTTQYLCRMIADADFDGVLYPSAQGGTSGLNYMLYDPVICIPDGNIEHVKISGISYHTRPIKKTARL